MAFCELFTSTMRKLIIGRWRGKCVDSFCKVTMDVGGYLEIYRNDLLPDHSQKHCGDIFRSFGSQKVSWVFSSSKLSEKASGTSCASRYVQKWSGLGEKVHREPTVQ